MGLDYRDHEDGGTKLLQNVGTYLPYDQASYHRKFQRLNGTLFKIYQTVNPDVIQLYINIYYLYYINIYNI